MDDNSLRITPALQDRKPLKPGARYKLTELGGIGVESTITNDKSFSTWAKQTYATKKEAVDFLENSFDPFDRAVGTLIKKYARAETSALIRNWPEVKKLF